MLFVFCRELLAGGRAPSERDSAGYTALHYAARAGKKDVCMLLLSARADVNAVTVGGATSLHRAAFCGHDDVVALLLRSGANPETADADGQTALHKAAEGGHAAVAALIVASMGTPALAFADRRGKTAHEIAVERHSRNIALLHATQPRRPANDEPVDGGGGRLNAVS